LDRVCCCGFTEAYEVGWANICKYALTNSFTGAWVGSYFVNTTSWNQLSPKLQELYKMSIDQAHYNRNTFYRDSEAKLRLNGKLELTSLPDKEWKKVVKDAKTFWDEFAKKSPRSKRIIEALKLYSQTMETAGYPYR
jgi:TRAP-type mannitol/chloroaromatic compound transport system substrate-binding protein